MNIKKTLDGTTLTVYPEGYLDTTTAPELDKELKSSIPGVKKLVIDCSKLEYVSSAGLRVFLSTHKKMRKQGEMCLINVNDVLMEVFQVTRFADILTIKR